MKNFFGSLCLILISMSLTSCASYFLKKKCEATNWFEYGENIAMKGQRVDQDQFVDQCRKAEADLDESKLDKGFKKGMNKYCLPEQVYIIGKSGEFFNERMCDGSPIQVLKQKHTEGVREYCQPANGVSAGAAGKKYNKICPAQLEKAFLPEFNKGRKQYLMAQIQNKKDEIAALDNEVNSLNTQKTYLMGQASVAGRSSVTRTETRFTSNGVQTIQVSDPQANINAQNESNRLQQEIRDVDWKMSNKRNEQSTLRKEIADMNAEMAGL